MEAGGESGAERENVPKRTQSEPVSSSTASGWALHPSADPGSSMFESNCFYNLGRCLSEQQDDAPGPRSPHGDTASARLSASAPAPHPSRLRSGQEIDDSLVLLSIRERDIDSDRRAMLDSHESVSSQDERSRSMCDLPLRTPAAPTTTANIPRPPPVNVSGYMTASTLAGLPSPTDASYTYGSASSSTSVPSPLESVRRLDLSSYEAGDLAALSIATSNLAEDMVFSSAAPAVAAPASSSSSPEPPSTPLGWLRHMGGRMHGVAAAAKTGFVNLVEATAETVRLLRGANKEPAVVLGSSTTSITTTPVTPPPSQRPRFRFPGRVDNMQWPEGSGVKRVTWWLVGLAIGCCVVFLLVPTPDPSVSWESRAESGAKGGKKGKAPSQPPSTTFGFGSRPSKAKMSKPVLNAPAPSASPPPSSSSSSSSSTVPSPSASASLSPPPARSYMFFDSSMKDFHEFLTGPRRGWGTGINTDDMDDLPGGVRDSNNTYSSSSSKDRRATRHILRVRLVYTTFKNACTALWNATGGMWHLATQALCGVLLRLLNHFPFIQPITRRFC